MDARHQRDRLWKGTNMIVLYVVAAMVLVGLAASVRILEQYERGVQFRPLMSTIGELGAFLSRENAAAGIPPGEPASPVGSNGDVART
jgi:hypothetical protein